MSKITQQKKAAKNKQPKDNLETSAEVAKSNKQNYGCCCTCTYYPRKVKGCIQPCAKVHAYVARKNTICAANSYKYKYN